LAAEQIGARYLAAERAWHVWVRGEHDAHTAPELAAELDQVIAPGTRVVVDLTETTFVDSMIINAILSARADAEKVGATLVIATAPGTPPRRVVELLGLPALLAGYPSLDAALAGLDAAGGFHAGRGRLWRRRGLA
jgi:anti-anti-sigma factor